MTGLEMKYFVLKPHGDDRYATASRGAMRRYADLIVQENPKLADELRVWAEREQLASLDKEPTPMTRNEILETLQRCEDTFGSAALYISTGERMHPCNVEIHKEALADLRRIYAAIQAAPEPSTGQWAIYVQKVTDNAKASLELNKLVEGTKDFSGVLPRIINEDGQCVAVTGCGPKGLANAEHIVALHNGSATPSPPAQVAEVK